MTQEVLHPESREPIEYDSVEVLGARMSPEIDQIAEALSKAQADINDPAKNASNPYYKSDYADLAQVLSVIRPAFSAHGLALVQLPSVQEDGYRFDVQEEDGKRSVRVGGTIALTTLVTHSSGQWIASRIHVPVLGSNPAQEAGKAITYMRRYVGAAVGAIAQIDEDGNDSMQSRGLPPSPAVPAPRRRQGQQQPRPPAKIAAQEVAEVRKLVEESGADEGKLCEHFHVDAVKDLNKKQLRQVLRMLNVKKEQQEKEAREAAAKDGEKPASAAPAS